MQTGKQEVKTTFTDYMIVYIKKKENLQNLAEEIPELKSELNKITESMYQKNKTLFLYTSNKHSEVKI